MCLEILLKGLFPKPVFTDNLVELKTVVKTNIDGLPQEGTNGVGGIPKEDYFVPVVPRWASDRAEVANRVFCKLQAKVRD